MDLFDKFKLLAEQHGRMLEGGADPFGVQFDEILSPTRGRIEGRDIVLAGTNNYLGLTFNQNCIDAAVKATRAHGTGTTGSRIANGTYAEHKTLEKRLAEMTGYKHGMVFSTGYLANLGLVTGLCGPGDQILIDADCHASIYDACRMSGATITRFRHNSADNLDRRLGRLPEGSNKLVIVEGLYSMLGDVAPLADLVAAAKKYSAYVCVDEAHSFGAYGDKGWGVTEADGCAGDVDFVVGTFSKSLGAVGGFCVSNHDLFPYLRLASRPYIFTAAPAPATMASVEAAIGEIETRPELRESLWSNAHALHGALTGIGLAPYSEPSPIASVKMPDIETAVLAWNMMLNEGVYVNLAIPPGTPNSLSLLRCSVSAALQEDEIETIVAAFSRVGTALGLIGDAAPMRAAQT